MQKPARYIQPSPVLAQRPGLLLRGAARLFSMRSSHAMDPLHIKTHHLVVMQILSEEKHPTQVRVGMRLHMDRTTMVKTIDDLEKLALAVRVRNPRDRRAYGLELTESGCRVLEKGLREVQRVEDDFFKPLSAAERRLLKGLFFRLLYDVSGRAPDETT